MPTTPIPAIKINAVVFDGSVTTSFYHAEGTNAIVRPSDRSDRPFGITPRAARVLSGVIGGGSTATGLSGAVALTVGTAPSPTVGRLVS